MIDTTKCIGCRACQVACKQWNQLPAEDTFFTPNYANPHHFSAHTWTRVNFVEYKNEEEINWFFLKQNCMHCQDAVCMQVCPSGAITHNEMGFVVIDEHKCISCNYCAANCTFKIMSFDLSMGIARKCNLCQDRIHSGLEPTCVKTCPTGALKFGERKDIIDIAADRKEELQQKEYSEANIYGLNELKGLNVIYILSHDPEKYGLPVEPEVPLKVRIWNYLFEPVRVILVIVLAFALFINKAASSIKD